MAAAFSSASSSLHSRRTDDTPGIEATRARMSRWSWARSGQPAVVRATRTTTSPSGDDRRAPDHAEIDDVAAQLGVDHAAQQPQHLVLGGRRRLRVGGVDRKVSVAGGSGVAEGT